tara:strand:- start:26 stop:214 length:189 start_codon:yes stop_codon:yes gene_type:complete
MSASEIYCPPSLLFFLGDLGRAGATASHVAMIEPIVTECPNRFFAVDATGLLAVLLPNGFFP